MNKIPVFDWLGRKVGDFYPNGDASVIGLVLLGVLFFLLQCLPPIAALVPIVALIWLLTKPNTFPYKKIGIVVCLCFLALELLGICSGLAGMFLLGFYCPNYPASVLCR